MNGPIVPRADSYNALQEAFSWPEAPLLNLGQACADFHPPSDAAIIEYERAGEHRTYTFGQLSDTSARIAGGLLDRELAPGDRVAILVPQSFVAAAVHLGIYKAGLVAVPLSQLFGPDAIRHRLGDSGARLIVVHAELLESVAEIAEELSIGIVVTNTERARRPYASLGEFLGSATESAATAADDPAFIIYTSGTTAAPKGALHSHQALIGHLPGFELSHGFFPAAGDLFWTPADWAWIGGLMDALLPSLYLGKPVVATPSGRFEPDLAVDLMRTCAVRNAFLPPTALRLMRQAGVSLRGLNLRTVMSGGESLDAATLEWFRDETGITVAEIYGQTEANYLIGNSPGVYPVKPGSMGRPYPGHEITLIDEMGEHLSAGEVGEIAVKTPDPVAFLGYWNRPEATGEKYKGAWLCTGDLATVDEDGYFWFKGRMDDLIISSGYRIAPVEVEACLLTHAGVAACAVIGVPDPVRGQVVKAFVVRTTGGSGVSEQDLREHVKTRLAMYEAPREVEFVSELPLTVTGKIRRRDLAAR